MKVGSAIAKAGTARSSSMVQLGLFEILGDTRQTQTIDLLDIAPRYVFYTDTDAREGGKYLSIINREFHHMGRMFSLQLRPARIIRNGSEIDVYPGEREQLVEEVVRKIAVGKNRLILEGDDVVLQCTLYELKEELKKRRHTLSYTELKESLTILHLAPIFITAVKKVSGEDDTTVTIRGSIFPAFDTSDKGAENGTIIRFNPILARAIKHMKFRPMSYETTMRLKSPIPRWLFKKFNQIGLFEDHTIQVHEIKATDIQRDCGLPSVANTPRQMKQITAAIQTLQEHGIIETFDQTDVMEGRRRLDIIYMVRMSESFMAEMKASQLRAIEDAAFLETTAKGQPAGKFIVASVETQDAIRRHRAPKRTTPSELLPRLC